MLVTISLSLLILMMVCFTYCSVAPFAYSQDARILERQTVPTICRYIDCAGTVKVIVSVEGGPLKAEDFIFNVNSEDPTKSFPGKSFGVPQLFDIKIGPYQVDSEFTPLYKEELSSECAGVMNAGDLKTCFIRYTHVGTAKLNVITDVTGGPATAADFKVTIIGVKGGDFPKPVSFMGKTVPGQEVVIIPQRDGKFWYQVDQDDKLGYVLTEDGECVNYAWTRLTVDETKTCTLKNNYMGTANLEVKVVVNDSRATASKPDAFTVQVMNNDIGTAFVGDSEGTIMKITGGTLDVTERTLPSGYVASYSPDCKGDVKAGEFKSCAITNNWILP